MSFSDLHLRSMDLAALGWLAFSSIVTFSAFAWDKYRAARSGWRVPEFHLAMLGALGGWPGGCVAMILLRHKTAKLGFKLKYTVALIIWCGLLWWWLKARTIRA